VLSQPDISCANDKLLSQGWPEIAPRVYSSPVSF